MGSHAHTAACSAMFTHSRCQFSPTCPDAAGIRIEDIAHCLARESRFCGAYDVEWYSVAEHSVFVSQLASRLARERGYRQRETQRIALAGLLHDAAEAYFKDLPSPIKHLPELEEYCRLEERMAQVIFQKYGCALPTSEYEIVAEADVELRHIEAAQLFAPSLPWAEPKGNLRLCGWRPAIAERVFLHSFYSLKEERAEGSLNLSRLPAAR